MITHSLISPVGAQQEPPHINRLLLLETDQMVRLHVLSSDLGVPIYWYRSPTYLVLKFSYATVYIMQEVFSEGSEDQAVSSHPPVMGHHQVFHFSLGEEMFSVLQSEAKG